MKRIIIPALTLFLLCLAHASFAQSADQLYKRGDSLSRLKDYRAAGITYEQAFALNNTNVPVRRYFTAARYMSLAGMPDSALAILNIIAASDKLARPDVRDIEYSPDLSSLQNDKRWQP